MASDTKNVKLGVCKVFYNDVDLGYTKGGVEVNVTSNTHKSTVDQFGETPITEIIMGRTVTATVPLAETTLANLVAIMPGATLVGTGAVQRVDVKTGTSINLLDIAQELRLHPKNKPDSDESDDFVIPKAATAGALQFAYRLDEERIFNVEFTGYPDPTSDLLFSVGDSAAV